MFKVENLRPQIKVKTQRIYFDGNICDELLKISDPHIINYLKNALRLKINSLIRIFDNSESEYLMKINDVQSKYITLKKVEILSKEISGNANKNQQIKNKFIAGICILKPEKMRDSVDVATQMGAKIIQPIISDRCQNFGLNTSKIKTWAIEASEQSERLSIPIVNEPIKLENFVKNVKGKIIVANEHFGIDIKDFFKKNISHQSSLHGADHDIFSSIILCDLVSANQVSHSLDRPIDPSALEFAKFCGCIIGPEGGFSVKDLELLDSDKIINVNFGSTILKSHVALAKILSFFC